jgi:subtilisin-like proprotein convertase family protein
MKNTFIIFTIFILFLINDCFSQYTVNYAGNFNGTNSYIAVPNYAELNPTLGITLEAWVNPSAIGPSDMTIIGKNFQTSYFLAIHPTGRVEFCPAGANIFVSKASSKIPVGKWTHIAGTYNGSVTKIFINGVLDTSTSAVTGPIGVNSDSLYIGADRLGNTRLMFFNGQMDNVRIWSTAINDVIINAQKFLPLELYFPSGLYANLIASFQLDNDAESHGGFSRKVGSPRNLTYVDLRDKAVNNMDYNSSLVLNGTTDHFTIINDPGFNATTAITLEAWIRRDTTGSQAAVQNIINKSGPPDVANYALWLNSGNGSVGFSINSPTGPPPLISPPIITNGQWNHIAVTYNSATGYAILYLNGVYVTSTIFNGHPLINSQGHNLYVGGIGISSQAANRFKGQIDGVRIWKHERKYNEIRDNRFRNISIEYDLAHLDFDKFTNSLVSYSNFIFTPNVFAGYAHVSSSHLNYNTELTSPILSDKSGGLDTTFTKNNKSFFIPDGNLSGIKDSILITSSGIITNLKAFVLLSHTYVHDVVINLISPSGTLVELFYKRGGGGNDIMTIFSDAADSVASASESGNMPGITPPFSPSIRPSYPLSAFNGENQAGWWKMQFIDVLQNEIGYVHSWGITTSIASPRTLTLTSLIQGFYNSESNKMVKDTVRVILRNQNSPYNIIDSAKSVLDSLGKNKFLFGNISSGQNFYIAVKHRNSIETWSSGVLNFSTDSLNYDFTSSASRAFGSNQINVDTSPLRFAIYNGDVNQDGTIDLSDLSLIDNDASSFMSGYVKTDLTGDNFVDLADLSIADNNAFNFVSVIRP